MGVRSKFSGLRFFTESDVGGTGTVLQAKLNANAGANSPIKLVGHGTGGVLLGPETYGGLKHGSSSGKGSWSQNHAEQAHAGGQIWQAGDTQGGIFAALGRTANATPVPLYLDGISELFHVQSASIHFFRVFVSAYGVTGGGTEKAWAYEFKFAVRNTVGGPPAQLGATNISFNVATGSTSWAAVPYINGEDVSIRVTGEADCDIIWSARFNYNRVNWSPL